MHLHRPSFRAVSVTALFMLLLALAGCSLAGEPVPMRPIESGPPPAEVIEGTLPIEMPRAADGELIYVARCAACHGADGKGQTDMASTLAQQGAELPDLSDPALARSRSPQDWYTIITNGTMGQGGMMPPWRDELTDSERWDVTYYLYWLSMPEEHVEQGRDLFATECTACHGPDGSGAGLTLPSVMAEKTQAQILAFLQGGDDDHDFGDWSEDDLLAVTAYTWTLGYDAPLTAAAEAPIWETEEAPDAAGETEQEGTAGEAPEATAEPTEEAAQSIELTGTVITAGGAPVEAGTEVSLTGISVDMAGNFNEFLNTTTTTDDAGAYRFTDLPADLESSAYVVTVSYNGVEFADGAVIDPLVPVMDLPIVVREATSDPGVISVDAAHIIFRQHPDALLVMQLFVFSNNSPDQVYLSEEVVRSGQRGSVAVQLPPDADSIQFEEGGLGGRFVQFEDKIYDTQMVLPGQGSHAIIVSYILPFEGSREVEIPFEFGAAQVTVLSQGEGQIRSSALESAGAETIGGETFNKYVGSNIGPGETLAMRVSTGSFLSTLEPYLLPGLIGLGVLLILGGGAYWYFTRSRADEYEDGEIDAEDVEGGFTPEQEALLKQIADLDNDYDAGKINRFDYEARRAEIKARLAELLRE